MGSYTPSGPRKQYYFMPCTRRVACGSLGVVHESARARGAGAAGQACPGGGRGRRARQRPSVGGGTAARPWPAQRGGAKAVPEWRQALTLLLAARARDGVVALSDRKETVGVSRANEVKKYHLDDRGSCYVALSGDGEVAAYILRQLGRSQVAGSGVFDELRRLAELLKEERLQHGTVVGHLVVAEPGEIKMYTIRIESGAAEFRPVGEEAPAEGDKRAIAIFENLAMDAKLCDMPCETVVRFLHTLASRIAETVKSVGRHDEYGMDTVVFAKSGGAKWLDRHKEATGALDVLFRPYHGELQFSGNGGAR